MTLILNQLDQLGKAETCELELIPQYSGSGEEIPVTLCQGAIRNQGNQKL